MAKRGCFLGGAKQRDLTGSGKSRYFKYLLINGMQR